MSGKLRKRGKEKMNIALNKEINKLRNSSLFNGCVHNDAECNDISKAHSIQNNGFLDNIAVNGEVLCIDFGKIGLEKHICLHNVGKAKASTFTGFCNYHDSKIFQPIELFDYRPNDIEQNFLYAYRAFALGYYERYSSFGFMQSAIENGHKNKIMEERIPNYKKHLRYIEELRGSMNTNLDNKRYDRICTEVLIWPQDYQIAATSMFFINRDKYGNVINGGNMRMSPFFFTIIPKNNNTYILMSFLSKDKLKYEFIKKQIVETDITEQKMLISNILAMNVENFFISPRKWDQLPTVIRELFINVLEATMGREKPNIGYFKDLNIFV
jgi:hypothetical protein